VTPVFTVVPGEQGLTVQRKQVETGETRQGRVAVVGGLPRATASSVPAK